MRCNLHCGSTGAKLLQPGPESLAVALKALRVASVLEVNAKQVRFLVWIRRKSPASIGDDVSRVGRSAWRAWKNNHLPARASIAGAAMVALRGLAMLWAEKLLLLPQRRPLRAGTDDHSGEDELLKLLLHGGLVALAAAGLRKMVSQARIA